MFLSERSRSAWFLITLPFDYELRRNAHVCLRFSAQDELEQAFQILLCALMFRIGKNFLCGAGFDHFAEVHVNDVIGEAARLPQCVCDNYGGVILFQVEQAAFDVLRGDRVEGGGRFVAEDDLRLNGQPAGKTEALLLSDGKTGGGIMQSFLNLVPQP